MASHPIDEVMWASGLTGQMADRAAGDRAAMLTKVANQDREMAEAEVRVAYWDTVDLTAMRARIIENARLESAERKARKRAAKPE